MDRAPVIRQSSRVAGTSGASHSMSFGWLVWVESCPRVSDLYDQLPERHWKTAVATSNTRAKPEAIAVIIRRRDNVLMSRGFFILFSLKRDVKV